MIVLKSYKIADDSLRQFKQKSQSKVSASIFPPEYHIQKNKQNRKSE